MVPLVLRHPRRLAAPQPIRDAGVREHQHRQGDEVLHSDERYAKNKIVQIDAYAYEYEHCATYPT